MEVDDIETRVAQRQVKCELIAWDSLEFERARLAWDELAAIDTRAPIVCYREWFELARRTGACRLWGVLLVSVERPVALLPVRKLFPRCWEVVSCFGVGELQILLDPAWEREVWFGLAEWMKRAPEIGLLLLGVSEREESIDVLVQACRQYNLFPVVESITTSAVWSELPESWEAFLRRIGPQAARNIRRAERKFHDLGSECTMELLTSPDECAAVIPEMARLYNLRWRKEQAVSLFSDSRGIQFYQQAIHWAARRGFALTFVIRLRGAPVLIQTTLHPPGQKVLYQHITARDVAALPAGYSPGVVGSAVEFRWAIEHGLTRINQGAVIMPYKVMFGGVEHPRRQIAIAQSPAAYRTLNSLNRGMHIARHLPAHLMLAARSIQQRLMKSVHNKKGWKDHDSK